MERKNNITVNRKGKHLIYEERIKIETLYKEGLSATAIGKRLNRSKRTIERELKRGMVELKNSDWTMRKEYSAVAAQNIHDEKATAKGPALKIGNDHKLVKYIESSIKAGYSPYATLQNIENKKLKFNTQISLKTLYNYIDAGLFINISNKDLLIKKNGKKRNYHKIRTAIRNKRGTSIAERPIKIDERCELGHWEMDTVVGKQGTKAALLVFTEIASRKELIFKIKGKTQDEVIRVLDSIERKIGRVKFSERFKTITTDNGCEFLDFEGIEKSLFSKTKTRTKMYFAHPFSSWERGSNENANKMIRRFIPKGVDISNYSNNEIKHIEHWMNNYPRKILGGLSANLALKNLYSLNTVNF